MSHGASHSRGWKLSFFRITAITILVFSSHVLFGQDAVEFNTIQNATSNSALSPEFTARKSYKELEHFKAQTLRIKGQAEKSNFQIALRNEISRNCPNYKLENFPEIDNDVLYNWVLNYPQEAEKMLFILGQEQLKSTK
jgi:hypothetical protein